MELIGLFILSIGLPIGAAYLFWLGLRPDSRIKKRFIIIGLLFLALVHIIASVDDGFVAVGVFFIILFTTPTAFLSGVVLAAFVNGKRRLASLVIAVLFPVTLFFSMTEANKYSVGALRRDYGVVIAQAIEQYHADNGAYPEALQQLVPVYLDGLRDSGTMWGWLYRTTDDEFSLGYVFSVHSMGYGISVLSSSTGNWESPLYYYEHGFDLPPTPGPGGVTFPLSTIVPTIEG